MHDTPALSGVLREIHTQIIGIAAGVQRLAELLEEPRQHRSAVSRFLSEEQFAEFLGTTVAALRTRRFRKQIPEAIWVKEGRRTLYSIKAYEQWIQEQMQSSLDPVPSPQQKARKRKASPKRGPGKRPYPLLV